MSSATYNGQGLRVSDTVTPSGGSQQAETFTYAQGQVDSPDLLTDSNYAFVYGPDGTPLEQVTLANGTIQYLVDDPSGSARGLVASSSGTLEHTSWYDDFGNPQTASTSGTSTIQA
jgi:hypothetical protein